MDGVVGVERCAPKAGALPGRATPRHECTTHSKALSDFLPAPTHGFLASTVHLPSFIPANCLLDRDRAHSFCSHRSYFAGSAVEFLQGFALHLQLHLRVLREDLRVSLAQHLSHPFIRHSHSTQPRSISGSQVVDAEIGDLGSTKRFAPNRLESGLVPAPIPITRKEKRTRLCDCHLPPKGFKRHGVRGTSAMPFGVFESEIQTTAFERSTWSFLIGASSL